MTGSTHNCDKNPNGISFIFVQWMFAAPRQRGAIGADRRASSGEGLTLLIEKCLNALDESQTKETSGGHFRKAMWT